MLERPLRLATGVIFLASVIFIAFAFTHPGSHFLPVFAGIEGIAGLMVSVICLIARRRHIPARSSYAALAFYIVLLPYLGLISLDSLNCDRCLGPDAAIQSNLNIIQTQAELYYGGEGLNTYGKPVPLATSPQACEVEGSMFASHAVQEAIASLEANGGSIECMSNSESYAALSSLPSAKGVYWCIDSTGNAYLTHTHLASTSCPAQYHSTPNPNGGVYDVHEVNCIPPDVWNLMLKSGMRDDGTGVPECPH